MKHTILLIDDDKSFRDSTSLFLKAEGFDVRAVANGDEAIALVRQQIILFSVALVDYHMPETSGLETIRGLKDADSKLQIFAFSGDDSVIAHNKSLESGAAFFIDKTISDAKLLGLLHRACKEVATQLGSLEDLEWETAFNEYVQVHFGIKASRASEYISISLVIANYKPTLNLEISKLVEISRLDKESIDSLIKSHPAEELNALTYREVKKLVRNFNPKKRDTAPVDKDKAKDTAEANENTDTKDSGVPPLPSNVSSLEDYIKSAKTTPSHAFASAAKVMKKEIGESEISEDICRIIDELYQWKMEKLEKKASGQ